MSEQILQREKIEDIQNLQDLKKYVCVKNAYKKDWYMSCVDCKDRSRCRAGKRAVILMEELTAKEAPKKQEAVLNPSEAKLRDNIIHIFTQKDPVKELLMSATGVKPLSIYQRVWSWKRKFPDLEKRFNMIQKVQFLWKKPYDSMKIPDILKELYPEKDTSEVIYMPETGGIISAKKGELSKAQAEIAEQAAVQGNAAEEEITLQDFLDGIVPEKKPAEKPKAEELKPEKISPALQEAGDRNGYLSYSDKLLKKLEDERLKCEKRIQTLDSQIAALKTVREMALSEDI